MPAVLFSLGGLTFPLAPRGFPIPVLLAGTVLFGYGGMAYNITQVSLRQAITPERLQGRMNASMRWIVWGTIPLGTLVGGALATAYGLRTALWVGAIGSLFTFLPLLLSSGALDQGVARGGHRGGRAHRISPLGRFPQTPRSATVEVDA